MALTMRCVVNVSVAAAFYSSACIILLCEQSWWQGRHGPRTCFLQLGWGVERRRVKRQPCREIEQEGQGGLPLVAKKPASRSGCASLAHAKEENGN